MYKLISFATAATLIFSVLAYSSSEDKISSLSTMPSLSWQVLTLERNIKNSIEQAISPILKSGQYYINVNVQTSIPETPDFYTSDFDDTLDLDSDDLADEAISDSVEEEIEDSTDEQILDELADLARGSNILFVDETPAEDADRFIVFSKLGIIAPLVDNFNDFYPDGKIVLSMDDRQAREDVSRPDQITSPSQQDEKLVAQGKRTPSQFEKMWKFNQALDILSNLRRVEITIGLNQNLQDVTRDTIERVVNSLDFNLGNIRPLIVFDYVPMVEKKSDDRGFFEKLFDFIERFSLLISIIIGSLILGAIAYLLFKRFEKMKKDAAASSMSLSGELKNMDEDKDDEEQGAGAGQAADSPDLLTQEMAGIDRFKAFFENSRFDACLLIKKWIKSADKEEANALRALVQQLDNIILSEIFKSLTEEERSDWKVLLDRPLGHEELLRANKFISSQIVAEIILPSVIVDKDVSDLLLKLRPERAAKLCEKHPKQGRILLNVMNAKFVSKILENVSPQNVDILIESSLRFNPNKLSEDMTEFKNVLNQYLEKKEQIPFLKKVREILPSTSPMRELPLYRALGSSGDLDTMIDLAMVNFPAHLVSKLPENFLKSALNAYPLNEKIEFFLSLNEEERGFYLNLSAPLGSKARDLLDIEFESASTDLMLQRRLKESGEEIKSQFVYHIRNLLKQEKSMEAPSFKIIEDWAKIECYQSENEGSDGSNDSNNVVNF